MKKTKWGKRKMVVLFSIIGVIVVVVAEFVLTGAYINSPTNEAPKIRELQKRPIPCGIGRDRKNKIEAITLDNVYTRLRGGV